MLFRWGVGGLWDSLSSADLSVDHIGDASLHQNVKKYSFHF